MTRAETERVIAAIKSDAQFLGILKQVSQGLAVLDGSPEGVVETIVALTLAAAWFNPHSVN